MIELTAVIVMGLVVLVFIVAHEHEKKEWQAERERLLNRIMSRTLTEYCEAEAALTKEKLKVVSVAELKRELQPEPEQGIPV